MTISYSSDKSSVATIVDNKIHIVGAGNATITATQSGNATYCEVNQSISLTVSRKALTVTAENKTRKVGESNPEFTLKYDGFITGEDTTSLIKLPIASTEAIPSSLAGDYPITVDSAVSQNYSFKYVNGVLTIKNKLRNEITNFFNITKTYGAEPFTLSATATNGTPAYSIVGESSLIELADGKVTIKGTGTVKLSASVAESNTHTAVDSVITLTIKKAKLTITAENKTRKVGEANPEFTLKYDGFITGEDESKLSTKPTVGTIATTNSPAREYDINVEGATSANYEFIYKKGTLTVIDKIKNEITNFTNITKTYGAEPFTLAATATNGKPAYSIVGESSLIELADGKVTIKGTGTVKLKASVAESDTHYGADSTITLTIDKANLTITANNKIKKVRNENPTLTFAYEGFVYGENERVLISNPTISTTAKKDSPIAKYDIIISGGEAKNYNIKRVNGTLTVTDKIINSITGFTNLTKTYADEAFSFAATATNGTPTYSVVGESSLIELVNGKVSFKGVGVVKIKASVAESNSHSAVDSIIRLTINKALLKVAVENKSKDYLAQNPKLTLKYDGFAAGESEVNLQKIPQASTEANEKSDVGNYPITVRGGASPNYDFDYTNGELKINAIKASITDFSDVTSKLKTTKRVTFAAKTNAPVEKVTYSLLKEVDGISLTENVIAVEKMATVQVKVSSAKTKNYLQTDSIITVRITGDLTLSVSDRNENTVNPVYAYVMAKNPKTKRYDTIQVKENVSGVSLVFENLEAKNYLVAASGSKEKLGELPATYFGDVVQWEEAEKSIFKLEEDKSIKITIQSPLSLTEPKGEGVVRGVIDEDFDPSTLGGGRILAKRRAKKRKCGLRKRRTGGRTTAESWDLFAYGETNDNGEFEFGFLPEGTYRFFVEFPGIPMDENAETEFTIGEKGISQDKFSLSVNVTDDGVKVEKVLGLIRQLDVTVYPNPASEMIFVETKLNSAVTIYNSAGKKVLSGKTNEPIIIEKLKDGIYLVVFEHNGQVISRRVKISR